jgi:hypothetical protein
MPARSVVLVAALCALTACGVKNIDDELDPDPIVRSDQDPPDYTQLRPARRDPSLPKDLAGLISALGDARQADAAIAELVARGGDAVPARGRAILALSAIDDPRVNDALLSIQDDTGDASLVRTWAAAARIRRAKTLDDVLGFAPLLSTFPALERPISLQVEARSEELGDIAGALRLIEASPQLGQVLNDAILGAGAEPLVEAMLTGPTQEVRRLAAGYLATLGQRDASTADAVARGLAFRIGAEQVPWAGGPLYVPSMGWSEKSARAAVGGLVSWFVFTSEEGMQTERQQVFNNLQSINLIRPAGLSRASNDARQLLLDWGGVVGREGIEKILAEQGLTDDPDYANVLGQLGGGR